MPGKIPSYLPNLITVGRLLAVPIMIIIMSFIDDHSADVATNKILSLTSGLLFTIAMSTDMVDGYLARKYNLMSVFGKFMDPLADKMLFIAAMIMMIGIGRMPAWIVALFFIREVAVTSIRAIAASDGIIVQASHWGKYKSAFVSCATVGLLIHYPFYGLNWMLVGWLLMIPSFAFSVGSGLHYAISVFTKMRLLAKA
jgi:CDP-diacylglycerol--glycerol-3-phosphate 3-phosphatidyltransferase